MAKQIQELNALVVQFIIDELWDGLMKSNPLWNHFSSEAGKKRQRGGINLQFPIKLLKNKSMGFIPGVGAVVNTAPSTQLQYGVLPWKYYNCNINFTLQDYNIAFQSKEAVMDFFTEKIEGAMGDMFRDLSLAVWGSSANNPLAYEGMADILADAGIAYAGLLESDYDDGAFSPVRKTDASATYSAITKMINAVRARCKQASMPNGKVFAFANEAVFTQYQNAVQAQQRFVNESEVAKTGFQGFSVNGVTFYLDADCPGSQDGTTPDNWIVIMPASAIKLWYNFGFGADSPFDTTKEGMQLATEPLKSIQKYLTGNIVCTNRRVLAVNKKIIA